MKMFDKIADPADIRRKLGLNQQEFWGKLGVTQSGGSRYESGRNMPRPVRALLRMVHLEQLDLARIKGEDFEVAEHLKQHNAKLYASLRQAARSKPAKKSTAKHR